MDRLGWLHEVKGDGVLLGAAGLSLVSGLVMASATSSLNPVLAVRHWLWIAIGLGTCWAVARTNARRWTELAWAAYGLSMLALALVPLAGAMRLGATRWLSIFGLSIQPSELAKLTTTWLLAHALSGQATPLSLRVLGGSCLIAAAPALLIFLQPDLGSATVLGAIWLGMVWVVGISRRTLSSLGLGLLVLIPLGWHVLKDYQRDRLLAFVNPHADPLGAGYTIIQSTIAIGSGRFWGRGWFAGTQNQLSFLPERHSDFIFSVIGEEWGFLGCLVTAALFGALLMAVLRRALDTSEPQGRLFATGIFAWITYQAFVNMGMVLGLLPVVGVPLPFVSYGGSSMVTLWVAMGLLASLRRAR